MESHVPVLFLDLNDDLLTPCDDDPVAAVTTGTLFGEKPETMIEIPIIKKEEREVSEATVCITYVLGGGVFDFK